MVRGTTEPTDEPDDTTERVYARGVPATGLQRVLLNDEDETDEEGAE